MNIMYFLYNSKIQIYMYLTLKTILNQNILKFLKSIINLIIIYYCVLDVKLKLIKIIKINHLIIYLILDLQAFLEIFKL